MDAINLLTNIYRLLLENRRNEASDLLIDFLYSSHDDMSDINLGKLYEGSPEEIVSRMRQIFVEQGLLNICNKASSEAKILDDLTDDDIDFINSVETGITAHSQLYIYDEEETQDLLLSNGDNKTSQQIDFNADGDDDVEEVFEEDSTEPDYDPTNYCNDSESAEDEYDDGFDEKLTLSDDVEPLDDLMLQQDERLQSSGNLVDDLYDDFFDFDEDDPFYNERIEFVDVDTDKSISREDRARQIAVQVSITLGWGRSGVDLLAEIFEEHGWGQARLAIESLAEDGIDVEQLSLINELKKLWEGNDAYSLAYLRLHNRTGYCTYSGGRVLSWVMAAKIAKIFSYGDICEIECFLDKAFDTWYDGSALKRRYPVYLNFIKHVLSWFDDKLWIPCGIFFDDVTEEEFEYETAKDLSYTLLYKDLVDFGLTSSRNYLFRL